jgi:transposase InsO family protein
MKCLISRSSSELSKWHRRLGHLSFNLLCRLSVLGVLQGLPLLMFQSNLVCASCHHGKMIVASHSPINIMMTELPKQLLHMDTVAPFRVHSVDGKWYVLVIVDDYLCYSWVYFLESKDEVFEHIQSLALRLNNEHPNCLKAIRSDNGTEVRNASFDQFCFEHGVDEQFSTPLVSQQNGVVEYKNCSPVEMARMMLDEHMTPRRFWAEAINTACYISNRIFLCSLLNLIPFELRFGCQLSVSHLRPFGCKCFILKHGNLDKFKSRSSDGIFLGYTPHGRSYRVLNLEINTVVESCDVIFDETAPCTHDIFESAGDKEMEDSIFVYEELQGVEGDKDKHIAPASTLSPGPIPASTLEAEAPQAATSSSAGVHALVIEGQINSENGAPSHVQKAHPPQ